MIDIDKSLEPITKRDIKFNLLFNKYQLYGYLFIFLCHFMASSSYLILYFIVKNKDITSSILLLFFVALALSFLFVYPMRISLVYSILYSRKLLLQKLLIYLKDKKLLVNEIDEKQKYTALLRTNVSSVVKEYCDFYFHLVLSLFVLITYTGILFYIHGIIYVIVVIVVLFVVIVIIKSISKEHKKLSTEMEDSENVLSQSLELSWNFITLGTPYYRDNFIKNISSSFFSVEKTTTLQEKYYRVRITFVSLMVIFIFAVVTFYLYMTNNFTVAQLVVSLPILNLILSHILNIARELAFANNLEGRLDSILKLQNLDESIKGIRYKLIKRINFDKIKIIDGNTQFNLKFNKIEDLEEFIRQKDEGIYLVKGENGVGKSSLLTLLSNSIKGSVYAPTIPLENNQSSTGQMKSKYILKQIKYSRENTALFIDEPYSNLSDKTKMLNILIEEAKNRLIVISIH